MPQIDESNASKASETLTMRGAAVLVDLGLVGLPTALLALLSTERFEIIEFNDGRARFAVDDQVRINEIDTGLNRAMQFGDTVFTLSGIGLLLTMLVLTTLTVLVFVVVPGLRRGQTPGRSIMGLAVRAEDTTAVEVLSVSVTNAEIETDEGDTLPVELFSKSEPSETKRDKIWPEPPAAHEPDEPSAAAGGDGVEQAAASDGITIVPDQTASVSHRSTVEEKTVETNDEPDQSAQQLRQELAAEFKQGTPPLQVTLGDDDDYAHWGEIDGLNLTDNANRGEGQADSFETLTLPESSLSETPLTATSGRAGGSGDAESGRSATATVEREQKIEDEVTPEITPEWSPEWQSWVYLDEANKRWFRHDQSTNRWMPIN